MKIIYNLVAVSVFVLTIGGSVFAQDKFVANILEFEVVGKSNQANQFVDAFLANSISDSSNFQKIFDEGLRRKTVRVLLEKSGDVSNGETAVLVSDGTLDLINNKKRKIGEVPRLVSSVGGYLLEGDGSFRLVKANVMFERNAIEQKIPAGEFFVPTDRRYYNTSISSVIGQITLLGGGRTPNGNFHFLAIYFSK